MAYSNEGRSMNAELSEGSTDGKYKKVVRDRGGIIDPATAEARSHLDDEYFGFHEVNPKVAPDGLLHNTPDYVATPRANSANW
jgi:hypothetical protein